MQKVYKAEAEYTDHAEGKDKCRNCKHFEVLAPNHCEAVFGEINAGGWCKLFEPKSRMARAMTGGANAE